MTSGAVAIVGISGVGKTYFIESLLSSRSSFVHLHASALLADYRTESEVGSEADVIESRQRYIAERIKAFCFFHPNDRILFDGHTVIDLDGRYVPVGVEVFRYLSATGFIFIEDDPHNVWQRRGSDAHRNRPSRSVHELEKYQAFALQIAREYSRELQVPLMQVRSGDHDEFLRVVDNLLSS